MELENTPFYRIVMEVLGSGETKTNYGWKALIHYGEQDTLRPLQVVSVAYKRDYLNNYTDELVVTALMGAGQYAKLIYPNRNNLQVSLQKIPQTEKEQSDGGEAEVQSERFSASLQDVGAAPLVGQGVETKSQQALDLQGLVEVKFQLYNKMVEQLRLALVGGGWTQLTMDEMLKATLSRESQKVSVDGVRALQGITVAPVSNQDVHPSVVVGHGIKLIDLPDLLQGKYGIYNAGLGSYIQNRHWHIYPVYDTTRFEEREQTLTLVVVPKRKFNQVERTYMKKGNSLTVLLTDESGFQDDSGKQYLREGNGARFSDATNVFEDVSTNTGNKAIISRKRNVNEFIAEKRSDGIENVPMPDMRMTANPFLIYSRLASRRGGYFKAVWQNADPKLLTPGMAVRVLYMDKDATQEVYGVLHVCVAVSSQIGGVTESKFMNTCIMQVFVHKTVTRDGT